MLQNIDHVLCGDNTAFVNIITLLGTRIRRRDVHPCDILMEPGLIKINKAADITHIILFVLFGQLIKLIFKVRLFVLILNMCLKCSHLFYRGVVKE